MSNEKYLERMMTSPQFSYFGIRPKWVPGVGDIDGFIHDEIVRQFHDTNIEEDGGVRTRWMKAAWDYAKGQFDDGITYPRIEDMLRIAAFIEPSNRNGYRTGYVTIGNYVPPAPERVPQLTEKLWQSIELVTPEQGRGYKDKVFTADDFYLEFESIHPFSDGNGRTGKVIHNWLLGTLDEPVLIEDYFHGGNP